MALPTFFSQSSLFLIEINATIILNNLEQFKNLLTSKHELSQENRYVIAYGACFNSENKNFLHCLIFELNLKEELIDPKYITGEVKDLFVQRKAEELSKELDVSHNIDSKKLKV
jgi:hypothetical protein